MTIYDFGFKDPFANGADSSEIQPFPDENRGLGIAFVQTDGKPEMKGLNGLFNKITKSLLSIRQNGVLGWVDDIEYIQGGFAVEGKKLYQAKVNNTNRKPSESQSDWELWTNASNIAVDPNGNLTKTTATDGAITLTVDNASTTKRGVARFATATEVVNKLNVTAAITPKNVSDMFKGGFTNNNSLTLPSGHILKWGVVDYSSNPAEIPVNVTFPEAFPNSCLNVQLTRKAIDGNESDGVVNLISQTNTGFRAYFNTWGVGVSGLRGFTWFAIGY